MPETPLQAQLAQLQSAWVARQLSALPTLAAQAKALAAEADCPPSRLQPLRDELHKLAGSAGTFGYPALGQTARRLEQCCQDILQSARVEPEQLRQLALQLHALPDYLQPGATDNELNIPEPPSATATTVRLLVVEDDSGLLADIDHTLTNYGYQTQGLEPGQSLTQQLEQGSIDALLLDISAFGSGNALLDDLQAWQARRPTPIPLLAISAEQDFATQMRAIRAGAVGFFPKPVDLIALEECLSRQTQARQDAAYRVLLVDDDQALSQRYQTVLQAAGMQVNWVEDPAQLLHQLRDFHPDVVLMDIHMPTYSGIELAQLIRLNDQWLRVPVIYLSAEADSSQQLSALLKAGDDFVSKPISDQHLVATVYTRAQRARLVSKALTRDSMTGLLKHADIKEQIELEIERAHRQQVPVSIAMIDIDHFKQVNDTYGHAIGDSVIRALASLLRQRLRRIDRVGRYGGEEFAAVLPNCSHQDAQLIFDQIREAFAGLVFRAAEGSFQVTFSAGISACEAPDWRTDGLLDQADQRLYKAKRGGRNQVISQGPSAA